MTGRIPLFFLILSGLCLSFSAWAEPLKLHPKLDPAFLSPPNAPKAAHVLSGERFSVSLRLDALPDAARKKALKDAGFRPLQRKGQWVRTGRVIPGFVSASRLPDLAALEFVERIEPGVQKAVRPMDTARPEVGLPEVYADYTDGEGHAVTGFGSTVCIDDGRVDLFHPAYFNPDGGVFSWIDTNGNDSFDPGTDAVDLNANQQADAGETLRFFDAVLKNDYGSDENTEGTFQADLDWLYNDANDDGARNFGPNEGFVETDPGYGERLFVVVDANGNRELDPGEDLLLLSTSKIRKAFVLNEDEESIDEYTRGVDLIQYPYVPTAGISHGTGTSGITASGWEGHRLHGVAYEAELVLIESALNYAIDADDDYLNMAAGLGLCAQESGQVILHEYCVSYTHPLDGSSNDAMAMTEAEESGLININPTCNYHASKKMARMLVPAGETKNFNVIVDPVYPLEGFTYLAVSFRWRKPDQELRIQMKQPDDEWKTISQNGYGPYDTGIYYWASNVTTERGTKVVTLILYRSDGQTELSPPYAFRLSNNGNTDLDMVLHTLDDVSHFYYGLVIDRDASDDGADGGDLSGFIPTYTLPSGADGGIGIGAHEHRDGATGPAIYSGRGLRIDGAPVVHVTAPFAQRAPGARCIGQTAGEACELGHYVMFGGTSSSSPFMAGVAALAKQVLPNLDAIGFRKALRDSSRKDWSREEPDLTYGYGRVWVPAMLVALDTAMTDAESPVASIYGEAVGTVGQDMVFSAAGSLDDRAVTSWDWTVDERQAGRAADKMWLVHAFTEAGTHSVRLTVTDEGGNTATAEKSVRVLTLEETEESDVAWGCFGGCNVWQLDRCQDTERACVCDEGTWTLVDCARACADQGVESDGCAEAGDGTFGCECSDTPLDGDEETDADFDGDESPDGDDTPLDGDDDAVDGDETPDGDDAPDGDDTTEDGDDSGKDGGGGSGCTNTSAPRSAPLLLLLLAGWMIRRRRIG